MKCDPHLMVFHCSLNKNNRNITVFFFNHTSNILWEFCLLFDWIQIRCSCTRVVGTFPANIRACSTTLKKLSKSYHHRVCNKNFFIFLSSEQEKSRVRISSESVVNFIDRFLLEQSLDSLLLLGGEFALGKCDVERDVEGSEKVAVLVVGHALALLADASSGPCDFIAGYCDFVAVLKEK